MDGGEIDVLVAGAGVIGLTTAICLAESGLRTGIRTAAPPEATTSAVAGAVWGPVMAGPAGPCREWARIGLEALRELEKVPGTGVRPVTGRELSREPEEPPGWIDLLDDVRLCHGDDLPPGFASGWRYTAPLVRMPVYLEYLRTRFTDAGGRIDVNPLTSLTEVAREAPVVINCTGVAARHLVPDPAVTPVRGQIVVIANPGVEEFYIDHSPPDPGVIYLFPHEDAVVLGGTVGRDDWDTTPRPETAERILRDCAAVEPRVLDAEVLAHRVGLRPSRPEVRLEAEPLDGGGVLWHNYGHGGAGVTLSWGCAREITAAVLGAGQHREGAQTPVYCATDPGLAGTTGPVLPELPRAWPEPRRHPGTRPRALGTQRGLGRGRGRGIPRWHVRPIRRRARWGRAGWSQPLSAGAA